MENPFLKDAQSLAQLVQTKQQAYGDSFKKVGQIMAILYPDGVKPGGFDDALALVRVLDKIVRIVTANGEKDALGENPWRDIAGYALLSMQKKP